MPKLMLVLISLLLALSVQAEPLKVLFVGNSYVYVHNVPAILKCMAEARGHELVYEQQTPGGRSFQQHWEEKKAAQKIKDGSFDVVIFQNQSFEPVSNPENTMKYGKMLAAEADKVGAKKLYYLTPAYREPVGWMKADNESARRGAELFPEMLDRLVKTYSELARETNGEVAPVGIAWKHAYTTISEIDLHAPDHSHAAPTGAYLTALVFYSTLYGEQPTEMPGKITVPHSNKTKPATQIDLDTKTREALEAAAWKACREFHLEKAR